MPSSEQTDPQAPDPRPQPIQGVPEVHPSAGVPQVHPRRSRRQTETSEYAAMMERIFWGLSARIAADPVALAHVHDLEAAFRDAVNMGVFLASRGPARYSLSHQAAIMGVTKHAIAKRRDAGEQVHVRHEAARSRGPLVRLADVRARRAARLAAVQLADLTGSERERLAR